MKCKHFYSFFEKDFIKFLSEIFKDKMPSYPQSILPTCTVARYSKNVLYVTKNSPFILL